ncbi:hypothetical protein LR69_00210 [Geobacillus sp. BCO2]|nr:hypothetical protein LR69_00210 [Geobacillus sp. BCO2]
MIIRMKRGMTLIELLAVLVIIGIVAMIVGLAMWTVIDRARERAFVSDAYGLYEAARLYVAPRKWNFCQPVLLPYCRMENWWATVCWIQSKIRLPEMYCRRKRIHRTCLPRSGKMAGSITPFA